MDATNPLWITGAAVLSPILVSFLKHLLANKKVQSDATLAGFGGLDQRNRFLEGEIDKLRLQIEEQDQTWRRRYNDLEVQYRMEHDRLIRFEARHEIRKLAKNTELLPDSTEDQIDYLAIFKSKTDPVVIADDDGLIIGMNPAGRALFGYFQESPEGMLLETLMPLRYRAAHRAGLERLRTGLASRVAGKPLSLHGLTKDNMEFEMELTVMPFMVDARNYFVGVIREVVHSDPPPEKPIISPLPPPQSPI